MTQPSKRTMWIITALYALVLVVVSVLPSGKERFYGWDQGITPNLQNALHVPAYALLVVLAVIACPPVQGTSYRRILLIALICCIFGTILELAQIWVPGRSASLPDALVNVAGIVVGIVIVAALLGTGALREVGAARHEE